MGSYGKGLFTFRSPIGLGLDLCLPSPGSPSAIPGDRAASPGKAIGSAAGQAGPGHQGGHNSTAKFKSPGRG